ncbi:MAG TPA: Gldg family protein, partial [Geminicoccaceae bacterium]
EREGFLEYDLTRMVFNLAHPEKPVVAVLSSLPLNADPALQYQPWQVTKELGQFFELRHLTGDIERIDDAVRILLLVHPQDPSEKTLYAIDQFVMRGGKALVMLDPHSEAQVARQRQAPGTPVESASSLPKLLESWGVEFVADRVVGDPASARQVTYPSGGRDRIIDYLPWLALDDRNLATGEVVTAELKSVNVGTAGILKAREGATTALTPLLLSSPEAMAIDAERVRMFPDPFALAREYKPGGERLVMAARVAGPAKSAFAAGRPAEAGGPAEAGAAGGEHVAEAKEAINLVLVADTDLLDDRSWLASQAVFGQQVPVPLADNANLVANALDFLAGSEALLDLRGRDTSFRPFTKVAEIRRAAEVRYRAKEQELQQKLADLQQKLGSLRVSDGDVDGGAGGGGEDPASLLSQRQRDEIEGFRGQLLDTRRELRDVQLALRQDIEDLQGRVRFLNVAAVPLLVALVAIVLALVQRARYRRRVVDATAAAIAA